MVELEKQARTAHEICLAITPDPIYGNKIKPTDKFLSLKTAQKEIEFWQYCFDYAEAERTRKSVDLEALKTKMREKVALLNRLIRQHPDSVGITTWLSMKEMLEKEFLGEEVTFEM